MSPDRRRWFVLNASPDIRTQIETFPALRPYDKRETPLRAVLLTDAELDHTLGLLLLREGGLELHATEAVRATLDTGTSLLRTLEAYGPVDWRPVVPGASVSLGDGLSYRAFDVPTDKPARFPSGTGPGRVVGYRLTDAASGRSVVYLPCVQELTDAVRAELDDCACLLVDGTCWHDDEMIRLGLGAKTAHQMGHLAIERSLDVLASLAVERTILIHINNTNPVLLEDSPERRIVAERGIEVATDGLEVRIT